MAHQHSHQRFVREYGPATGKTVATPIPDDLILGQRPPVGPISVSEKSEATPAAVLGSRRLNDNGKTKVRRFVKKARSLEDLADIEIALDGGNVPERLLQKLGLSPADFERPPIPQSSTRPPVVIRPHVESKMVTGEIFSSKASSPPAGLVPTEQRLFTPKPPSEIPPAVDLEPDPRPSGPAVPILGTRALSESGKVKLKRTIEVATDLNYLAVLDKALMSGDITSLRSMLKLEARDLIGEEDEDELSGDHSESTEASDDDYDPFAVEPSIQAATQNDPELPKELDVDRPADPRRKPPQKRGRRARVVPNAGVLGVLQSEYAGSDGSSAASDCGISDGEAVHPKRSKVSGKSMDWPVSWAWLLDRTLKHPDFRAPETGLGWVCVEAQKEGKGGSMAIALAISSVYAGGPDCGYDPRHLGRLAAVDDHGEVVLDVLIKPRMPLLDCRTHLTGLTREALTGPNAVDFEEARKRLLAVLRPCTLLVGYKITGDLESLKLWHRPVIDLSLLFKVESRKQHQYHPLRWLLSHLLREEVDDDRPHDALDNAEYMMRLANFESEKQTATPSFPPRPETGFDLVVRHIPREWSAQAAVHVLNICPGANQQVSVRWLLSETDPSDWRGEAVLTFPSQKLRDASFANAQALTDVHVAWSEVAGAPPLGAFMTEQGLIETFSRFGLVMGARIPRKPSTREPQSFAFISFLDREDAVKASKTEVGVEITPTWKVSLRPRVARFGNTTDKRVAVEVDPSSPDEFGPQEWVHLCKR